MQFAHPNLLWLIPVAAPVLIAFFWWSARRRRALLTAFIQSRLLPGLLSGVSEGRQRLRAACITLAVCLGIVALARPQWGFTWEEVKQRGLDIVVGIDVSKSMLATDIQPSRLARAKLAAVDLMRRAQSDRLGLVVFAGSAFLQCPLTIDDSVFRQSVESLDVQSLSRGGTAISEAIDTAMSAFTEGENYKVLVLLTDGEDQDSGALDTAKRAVEKGLEIFAIGIGTPEGEMVQVKDASGKVDFVRDENGNVVKSRLNETLLRELAGLSSRGFYLPLRGAKAIDTLYEQGLAPIPKSESGEKLVKRYFERYHWPLGAALALLIFEMLFPERRNRPMPTRNAPANVTVAGVAALLLLVATGATASPRSAAKAYDEGEYKKALRDYKDALQKQKDDPRLHYNAGNAAFRSRQLEEAANQFEAALSARDLELQQRAFYNRGNTFYAIGEQAPDPQQKAESWQKSLKDFEAALKLNPKDLDAAHNRDVVKRRLEELQQQQQQQQNKNDQNKDENKDQKQDNQQQKDQQKQDQQKQDQQQDQNKQGEQEKQQQNQNPEQKKEQEKQNQQSGQDEKKEEQQSGQKNDQGPKDQQQPQPQQPIPGQMSQEQARQLLDAQKGEEKILQFRPEEKPADASRPMRDW